MANDSEESDVFPLLKRWNLKSSAEKETDEYFIIQRANVSSCGNYIAILTEKGDLKIVNLKSFNFEETISNHCVDFSWIEGIQKDKNSGHVIKNVVSIDKDNSIIVHFIDENIQNNTTTSGLVNIVGKSIFQSEKDIQLVRLITCSEENNGSFNICCSVNDENFVTLLIPMTGSKEPQIQYSRPIFNSQTALLNLHEEKIKIFKVVKDYVFVVTTLNVLWIFSKTTFEPQSTISLNERFQFHNIYQFGVIMDKEKCWSVFTAEDNQIYFLRIDLFESKNNLKDSEGSVYTTWSNRISLYKKNIEKKINEKVKEVTAPTTIWEEKETHTVQTLKWLRKFQISFLHCSQKSLVLVYEKEEVKYLVKYDLHEDHFCISELLSTDGLAVSDNPFHPVLVVTFNKIALPMFGATKEELIDKIVKHSGIAEAEKFCQLNNWDQFSVPLHTLEVGLKHRQLETIAFFLKSHTKVFTHYWRGLCELPTSNKPSLYYSQKSSTEVIGSDEMINVIEMLMKAVRQSVEGAHKQAFLHDLLKISINYLKNLVKDGIAALPLKLSSQSTHEIISRTKSFASSADSLSFCFLYDIDESLLYISDSLVELQGYLQPAPSMQQQSVAGHDTVDAKPKDLTMDGINNEFLNGNIATAQKHLLNHNLEMGSAIGVLSHARNLAIECLRNREEKKTEFLLTNFGLDFISVVKDIYESTFERKLRSYLHELLKKNNSFTVKDTENYSFIQQLEDLYSCDDFIEAAKKHSFNWDDSLQSTLLPSSTNALVLNESKQEKDDKDYLNGCYGRFSISMIKKWCNKTRENVIIDGKFLANAQELFTDGNSKGLWDYLMSRHDVEKLSEWISSTSFQVKLPDQFMTENSTNYAEHKINLVLVKHGFYPQSILDDFAMFLNHLCQTNNLFSSVHPIHFYKKEICEERRKELYFIFNNKFAVFCQKNDLMLLLWHFVQHYSLVFDDFAQETLFFTPWFKFLLSLQLYLKYKDLENLFKLLVENSSMKYSSSNFRLSDLLQHDEPIVVLACMLLCNLSKETVFEGDLSSNPYYLEKELFEKTLRKYPQLHASYFQESDQAVADSVTFYQLLQDNTDLDCKRLFSWQTSNLLAVKDDILLELPHFSHPYLVKKYGHDVLLNHQYYLKQSRPFFAYLNYIQNDQHKVAMDTRENIERDVYIIAMQNHETPEVVASCVMFLSMMSLDCEKIKVDAHTINLICKHCVKKVGNDSKLSKHSLVQKLVNNKLKDLVDILNLLEDATDNFIYSNKVLRFSYKAVCHWRLAVRFSRIHNLPVTTRYITSACKEDDWLQIFLFIHMYQVPRKQVISAIESSMQNKKLMEHLVAIVKYASETRVMSNEQKKQRRKMKEKEKDLRKKSHPRDIRAQFYSRLGTVVSSKDAADSTHGSIGVSQRNMEAIIGFSDDIDSLHTLSAETQHDDLSEKTPLVRLPSDNDIPKDIIDIILRCQEEKESWLSLLSYSIATWHPLLPVVAACSEKSRSVDCLCIWLFCGMEPVKRKVIAQKLCGCQVNAEDLKIALHSHIWEVDDVLTISKCLLEEGVKYIRLLHQGFLIFRQGDILCYFLEFLNSFLNHEPINNTLKLLERYQTEYARNKQKEVIGAKSTNDICFCERYTHESITVVLRISVRYRNMFVYELVKCLSIGKYGESFSIQIPNYHLIKESLSIIREAHIDWSFTKICVLDTDVLKKEIQEVVKMLLKERYFEEASDLSKLHSLPECQILVNKIYNEMTSLSETEAWKDIQVRYSFWNKTDEMFKKGGCSKSVAAKFFKAEGLNNSSTYTYEEKSMLLMLSMKWYQHYLDEQNVGDKMMTDIHDTMEDMKKSIWKLQIYSMFERKQQSDRTNNDMSSPHNGLTMLRNKNTTCSELVTDDVMDVSELLQISSDVSFTTHLQNDSSILANETEEIGFELFLNQLLDDGHVREARKVASYFQQTTIDFDIVMSSILLAQGYQSIDSVSDNIKAILAQTTSRHISISGMLERSGSFTRPDSLQSNTTHFSNTITDFVFIEETQSALEKLTLRVNHGKKICQQVLSCFKIASILCTSYKEIVLDDRFNTLRKLLETGRDNRRQLSKQFIRAFNVDSTEVVSFISETMIHWTKLACGEELMTSISTFNFEPQLDRTFDDVISLVQLTDDVVEVGNNIFQAAIDLSNNSRSIDRSSSNLQLEVELLILAHYCFTVSCDMDGIASILRAVRHCNATLSMHKEYKSMARLLLGIGRFRDTMDIIKSLYELQFFEHLIKKDIPQEEELKGALLDFLKKHHPEDVSTLNMILHGFGMYRQIAQNHENTARKQVEIMRDQMKDGINKDLIPASQAVARTFSYATDNYIKAGCYGLANKCSRLSLLAQLQAQLIQSNICVLGLDKPDVIRFVSRHSNVVEALLVADFYALEDQKAWDDALYYQVICKGNFPYLQQFVMYKVLTPSICFEIATKFRSEKNSANVANMKKFLRKVNDVKTKIKIAKELNFQDIEKEIIESSAAAYLRDHLF